MTQSEMFEDAVWIDCHGADFSPIFIKKFNAVKKEEAEIVICGLGFFELYINERRVSDDLLVPSASNYSYRDMSHWSYPLFDKLGFRTYCLKYDISDYLTDGINTLKVMLGTGYYHQNMRLAEGNPDYGTPKLCYLIRKQSGNVISDSNTLCHKGYFDRCNLYYGEIQDYTKVPEEKDFSFSREIETPETDFYYQIAPADKVIESISDITFLGEYEGKKYYDCGKNTVGYAVLKCDEYGERFKVEYAEDIGGSENFGIHFNDTMYADEFVSDGKQNEYHEKFGWQGFRYFRIGGNAVPVRIDVVHSDCDITSSFECDNKTAEWLYNTFVYTQLCNMHSGVPSDCPHRERLGYTGDGQLCAESSMLLLDTKSFYRKWLNDISDCQCRESGHVQHTAPPMGGGGGPCGWGGAIVEVPYIYYKIYGDKSVLEEFFPKMLHYFEYLDSRSENGLVFREEEGGWCLGDWLPPTPIQIPETYVNSCLYAGFIDKVIEIASVIGKSDEASFLKAKSDKIKNAINVAYYSFQQGSYCGDINGASSFALSIGLGNDKVKNKVIDKYTALGQYDTGIIGTVILTEYLFKIGENNLAFNLLTNEKDVSFTHMMKSGATTLWENWDGASSRNHPMFGAVTKLLFTYILGITQPENEAGFKNVIISPRFVDKLNKAKGHITTVNGIVSVEYEKINNKVKLYIFADERTNAEFRYKDYVRKISGKCEFEIEI